MRIWSSDDTRKLFVGNGWFIQPISSWMYMPTRSASMSIRMEGVDTGDPPVHDGHAVEGFLPSVIGSATPYLTCTLMSRIPQDTTKHGPEKGKTNRGGWFWGRWWWWKREPNPRPFSEPDSNALGLRAWVRGFGHRHCSEPKSNSSQSLPDQRKPSSSGMADAPFGRIEKCRLFPVVLSDQVAWQVPHWQ